MNRRWEGHCNRKRFPWHGWHCKTVCRLRSRVRSSRGTGCPNDFFRIRDLIRSVLTQSTKRGASAPPVILGDDATTKRRNIPVAQLLLRELRPTLLRWRIRCRCCCRHPRRQPPLPTGLGLWACRPRNVTKSSYPAKENNTRRRKNDVSLCFALLQNTELESSLTSLLFCSREILAGMEIMCLHQVGSRFDPVSFVLRRVHPNRPPLLTESTTPTVRQSWHPS